MGKLSNRLLAAVMATAALLLCAGGAMISVTPRRIVISIASVAFAAAIAAVIRRRGTAALLKSAPWLMGGLVLVLFLTRFTPLGHSVNGSMRYFHLNMIGFGITPALLSMPILCLFWARYVPTSALIFSAKRWLILILPTLAVAVLIFLEPFTSMTAMIAALWLILLFISNPRPKIFVSGVAAVVLIGVAVFPAARNHKPLAEQKDFYLHLFAPDRHSNYHTWSLLTTLKYSSFAGKHHIPDTLEHHIPNAATDAPLIAGCGDFGYVFLIGAILLIGIIIACGVTIVERNKNPTDRLLAGGMTAAIALPTLVNIAMMFGLLPMGGVAFPLLAIGGTAMFANFFALGMIIGLGVQNREDSPRIEPNR